MRKKDISVQVATGGPKLFGIDLRPTFDFEAVARLAGLAVEARAKIVFTTSWREGFLPRELCQILRTIACFPDKCFAGVTPVLPRKSRGAEIATWLDDLSARFKVANYIILDDAPKSWFSRAQLGRLVHVDRTVGLQQLDVSKAIALFSASDVAVRKATT